MENKICGFIELNGELVKISSVEDLKALAARLGSAFTELTTQDYETLCNKLKLQAMHSIGITICIMVYCIPTNTLMRRTLLNS